MKVKAASLLVLSAFLFGAQLTYAEPPAKAPISETTLSLSDLQALYIRLHTLALRSRITYTRLDARGIPVADAQDELAIAQTALAAAKSGLDDAANPLRIAPNRELLSKIALTITNARGHIIQSLTLAKAAIAQSSEQN